MKLKISILFFLLSTNSFAHKDKYIIETYGNVKTLIKTGFDYSEIDKIKIIGQLAEKLAIKLNYKDSIFIEYDHDYTDLYKDDLYMLEYNGSKLFSRLMANYNANPDSTNLFVFINANNINIITTLKLVEFGMFNKEKVNEYLFEKKIRYYDDNDKEIFKPLNPFATDKRLISQINSSQSKIINEVINERIIVSNQRIFGIEIYWQSDKFFFEYKNVSGKKNDTLFEIHDFYYSVSLNQNDLLIFINKNEFYFLDGSNLKEKKLNRIKNGSYLPVRVLEFKDKILIYDRRDSFNVFLPKKNKTITKFE